MALFSRVVLGPEWEGLEAGGSLEWGVTVGGVSSYPQI